MRWRKMGWGAGGAAATYLYLKKKKKRENEETTKSGGKRRWECVQLNHHKEIGRTIEEWESNGWDLFSYTCAQLQNTAINHYLLFVKEE
jgi:hypothetical protein